MLNNTEIGRLIGVSFSMASRLRSGDRTPGIQTMRQIEQALPDFSLELQVQAREKGNYADQFNAAVDRWEKSQQALAG